MASDTTDVCHWLGRSRYQAMEIQWSACAAPHTHRYLFLSHSFESISLTDNKAWVVETMHGHSGNVSSVLFHPHLDIILSNSEDRTIRVWEMDKSTSSHMIPRTSDRFWGLDAHPTLNLLAAAHDTGFVVFKLHRNRPPMEVLPLSATALSSGAAGSHALSVAFYRDSAVHLTSATPMSTLVTSSQPANVSLRERCVLRVPKRSNSSIAPLYRACHVCELSASEMAVLLMNSTDQTWELYPAVPRNEPPANAQPGPPVDASQVAMLRGYVDFSSDLLELRL